MADRRLDWRAFLSQLRYCFCCGRFVIPGQQRVPQGWSVLYQPHPDAPAGLLVCSEQCASEVRIAMALGPVTAPLRMVTGMAMSAEMRSAMIDEAMQHAIDSGRLDDLFLAALVLPDE